MATIFDPVQLSGRGIDMTDLMRAIGGLPEGRTWAALFPFAFGVQRLYPTEHLKRPFVEAVNGAVGVATQVVVAAPPTNKLRIVEIASAFHDDATPRVVTMYLRTTIGGSSTDVPITGGSSLGANAIVTNNRYLALNEAQSIICTATALGAGSSLFTRSISWEIFVGEDVLTL